MKKLTIFAAAVLFATLTGCTTYVPSQFEPYLIQAMDQAPDGAQKLVDEGVKMGKINKSQADLIMKVVKALSAQAKTK